MECNIIVLKRGAKSSLQKRILVLLYFDHLRGLYFDAAPLFLGKIQKIKKKS